MGGGELVGVGFGVGVGGLVGCRSKAVGCKGCVNGGTKKQ